MSLKGIYCPVVTPFVDGRVALDKLAENIQKLNSFGLDGYVVLGSTGEPVFLSEHEKIEIIKVVRKNVPDSKKLIVATGLESTAQTIDFTQTAADLGADYALVLTPYYYKRHLSEDCFKEHFVSVAGQSQVPVLLYNVPGFTGIDLKPEIVGDLASHENIVGIKDSTGDLSKLKELMNLSARKISVLIGNADLLLPGFFLGAQGAILSICNVAPKQCTEVYRLCSTGSFDAACQQFLKLMPFIKTAVDIYGVPAIKAAMDMLGFFGGEPRKPLLPLQDRILTEIKSQLKALN